MGTRHIGGRLVMLALLLSAPAAARGQGAAADLLPVPNAAAVTRAEAMNGHASDERSLNPSYID